MSQAELFAESALPEGDGWRIFKGTGGDVRYLTVDERIVPVDLGTGETLPVTHQSQNRNYTVVPGYGAVQERAGAGGKVFLSKLSMVRSILEERAARKSAEAAAEAARRREGEAVDNLLQATIAGSRGGGGWRSAARQAGDVTAQDSGG